MAGNDNRISLKQKIRKKRLDTGKEFWEKYYRRAYARRNTRRYERVKKLPIDPNLIFFESFLGKGYADSPRAIFEEIQNDPEYAGYRFVWSVNRPKTHRYLESNPRVRVVKRLSREYYEAFATARYIINNITNNEYAKKKPGQTYIQTWHGTPLKRLGCDIEIEGGNGAKSRDNLHRQYRREASQFDHLLSPSAYTSEKLASAFGLSEEDRKNKIVELGYPRNAALFTTTEEEKKYLRHIYNIPEGKKVVLYCTTWREDKYKYGSGFEYKLSLDPDSLYKRFGDKVCFIVRLHYNHQNNVLDFSKYRDFLINGTNVEEVNRLYVIADALITDYSSVMFDYANLKRPIVLYMYDRERYEYEIRGFYFDVSELPAPIVTTQDELEDALEKVLFTDFVPDEKYRAFNKKFNYLDDEYATKRVVERLIPKHREQESVPAVIEKRRARDKKRKKNRIEWKIRRSSARFKKIFSLPLAVSHFFESVISFFSGSEHRWSATYARYLKKTEVDMKTIFLESGEGTNVSGMPNELFGKLLPDLRAEGYTYVWVVDSTEIMRENEERFVNYENVEFVVRGCRAYLKALASASVIVNNGNFPDFFTKRHEQTYVNIWHDCVSKEEAEKRALNRAEISKITADLLKADYIITSGRDMTKWIAEKFRLNGLYEGRFLETGNDIQASEEWDIYKPDTIFKEVFSATEAELPSKYMSEYKTKLLISEGHISNGDGSSAFINLLNMIDHDRIDVTVLVEKGRSDKKNPLIDAINDRVRLIYRTRMPNMTVPEILAYRIRKTMGTGNPYAPSIRREWRRTFGDSVFDRIVDFSGNLYLDALLMASQAETRHIIMVRKDMMEEKKNRNGSKAVLKLYKYYDGLFAPTEMLRELNSEKIQGRWKTAGSIGLVEDICDDERIIELSKEEIWPNIRPNVDENGNRICNFVAVSKFTADKNPETLIRAFAKFHAKNPDSWLYILGSGPARGRSAELSRELGVSEYVSLPGNVRNPYVVYRKCGCFIIPDPVFSNRLTIEEARVFKKAVVIADFLGVAECSVEKGQLICTPSEKGFYDAMMAYRNGKIPENYSIDVPESKKKRIEEFYDAIEV